MRILIIINAASILVVWKEMSNLIVQEICSQTVSTAPGSLSNQKRWLPRCKSISIFFTALLYFAHVEPDIGGAKRSLLICISWSWLKDSDKCRFSALIDLWSDEILVVTIFLFYYHSVTYNVCQLNCVGSFSSFVFECRAEKFALSGFSRLVTRFCF